LIYAWWANRKWTIPLRDSDQAPLRELESATARSEAELPSLWASLLPIVLPVLLITSGTVLKMLAGTAAFEGMQDWTAPF
jgi:GntP family gluconate:H+ symporter